MRRWGVPCSDHEGSKPKAVHSGTSARRAINKQESQLRDLVGFRCAKPTQAQSILYLACKSPTWLCLA